VEAARPVEAALGDPDLAVQVLAAAAPPELIEAVYQDLLGLQRRAGLALAVATGGLLIARLYGGDFGAWRARGPKDDASLRALAERFKAADMTGFSATNLYRAIAVAELVEQLGGVPSLEHRRLTLGHLRAALGAPADERATLLDRTRLGADIWRLRFSRPEATAEGLADWQARSGQYVTLGLTPDLAPRPYSIASAAAQPYLDLHISDTGHGLSQAAAALAPQAPSANGLLLLPSPILAAAPPSHPAIASLRTHSASSWAVLARSTIVRSSVISAITTPSSSTEPPLMSRKPAGSLSDFELYHESMPSVSLKKRRSYFSPLDLPEDLFTLDFSR
jgi:hypothetical protein